LSEEEEDRIRELYSTIRYKRGEPKGETNPGFQHGELGWTSNGINENGRGAKKLPAALAAEDLCSEPNCTRELTPGGRASEESLRLDESEKGKKKTK